jgi:ATP-dependent DNA helicase DinG
MANDYIEAVFGAGGLLAQRFPGYSPRPGQVRMARAIDGGVRRGENVIVEAPTGVGKSVAYLVPGTYYAAGENPGRAEEGEPRRRVVVVTANIALQEQLILKDLPLLAELLPWRFTYALAKGRNNYLCSDALDGAQAEEALFRSQRTADEEEQWRAIETWASQTTEGDLSELPFEPLAKLRPKFTTSSEDCTGKSCPRYDGCFAERARRAYADADVVVTNYHMLFAHLTVKAATDGNVGVLPEHEVVVLDEAHKAADIARDFLGFRVTAGSVRWATRLLAPRGGVEVDRELAERVQWLSQQFFGELRNARRAREYFARLREPDAADSAQLVAALRRAGEVLACAGESVGGKERGKYDAASRRCHVIATNVARAMALGDDGNVYFVEEEGDRVVLASKPIDVAPALRERLFEAGLRSVAMTSATLQASGSFDYVVAETGCDGAVELAVESPFDWRSNALVIVPQKMPLPTEREYLDACARAVAEVVALARGRTLGLFTSYRAMNACARELKQRWGGRVLVQGDAPRTQLSRAFREDVGSVLLGTESFWAGVDVPGESLSCVVIDRLPFASPEDPVLDAVSERDRRAFFTHQVPRAVIAFRQGVGRLIRAVSDRGVVVVLDPRVVLKGYGRNFYPKGLPPGVRLSRRLEDVRDFLDGPPASTSLTAAGGAP